MAYCYEHAIPHSEYLEWSPEDRAKIIAFKAEQALRCDSCGTAPWEWDPKQGGDRFAYDPVAHFCPGCKRKSDMAADADSMAGTTVKLIKLSKFAKAKKFVAEKRKDARRRADTMAEARSA